MDCRSREGRGVIAFCWEQSIRQFCTDPDERLGTMACGRRKSLLPVDASIWFILSSETTSGIYHVRSCLREIRFISTIGGSRLVSVNETCHIVFVVGLIRNRAQLAQTWYA